MKEIIRDFLILGSIGASCISITEDKYITYFIGIIVGFVGCLSFLFIREIIID